MKLFMLYLLLLSSLAFLPACSVYTVTNKTEQDVIISKSGEEESLLKAGDCIELREYFLGLGGNFPFIIEKAEDKEYSAGNYEIQFRVQSRQMATSSGAEASAYSVKYVAAKADKNLNCRGKSESSSVTIFPMCGDTEQKATCTNTDDGVKYTAKCILEKGKNIPACVDENEAPLVSETPSCSNSSLQVVCRSSKATEATQQSLKINRDLQVLCLTGLAQCPAGSVARCKTRTNTNSSRTGSIGSAGSTVNTTEPTCVDQNNHNIDKKIMPSCPSSSQSPSPICTKAVVITKSLMSPLCGAVSTAQPAQCPRGGQAVCGIHATSAKQHPYCINSNGLLWSKVHCPNNIIPVCRAQQ